jgi:hypothetical protein
MGSVKYMEGIGTNLQETETQPNETRKLQAWLKTILEVPYDHGRDYPAIVRA